MKRTNYLLATALLIASFSLPGLSQNTTAAKPPAQKPADPCAQYKKAPKNEIAADKKKREADLKACTDKEKAEAKAAKEAPKKK